MIAEWRRQRKMCISFFLGYGMKKSLHKGVRSPGQICKKDPLLRGDPPPPPLYTGVFRAKLANSFFFRPFFTTSAPPTPGGKPIASSPLKKKNHIHISYPTRPLYISYSILFLTPIQSSYLLPVVTTPSPHHCQPQLCCH